MLISIIDTHPARVFRAIINGEMTKNVRNQDFLRTGGDPMWVVKDFRMQVFQESQVLRIIVAVILSHTYHRLIIIEISRRSQSTNHPQIVMVKDIRDGTITETKDTRSTNSKDHMMIIIDYHHLLCLQGSMERASSRGDDWFEFRS